MNKRLTLGDCLEELDKIEENSIDAIITDPPYELNFMNKGWDNAGVSFNKNTWEKCLRVLKPGGYLLAFGGSRTFHRIACAIEDAGFDIRDTILWLYGSGFPKSMNIGLALDKKLGNESKVVGSGKSGVSSRAYQSLETTTAGNYEIKEAQNEWNGWGTQLKPAFEPIIVARKPFKGSLVGNILKYGVGGLNIDECRVGDEVITSHNAPKGTFAGGEPNRGSDTDSYHTTAGRFPANIIHDGSDEATDDMPQTKGCQGKGFKKGDYGFGETATSFGRGDFKPYNDSGSAARYFMNCKYTGKDEEIWKQLLVNNVENNLEISKATKDNIVQMNVEDLLKELKDHYARYAGNQLDLTETPIVQDIAEMLTWDSKTETSQVIQDFIINSKKCIQFLSLVQFVEKMDNIDTTQTTQNLLKLFGYVKVAITNYIQGNIEYDQKRYIYTPKASKKDRDEGLDGFKESKTTDGNTRSNPETARKFGANSALRRNVHPTVKPTTLMQYLVRLVCPKGSVILDPFMGSGSTGKAVAYENKERNAEYSFIGIEQNPEYVEIAKARIEFADIDNATGSNVE